MRLRIAMILVAVTLAGCNRPAPTVDDDPTAANMDQPIEQSASDEARIDELRSKVADLKQKVADLESAAKEAKRRADEAHDLAEEAEAKARKACQPYGYQYGCGNSG